MKHLTVKELPVSELPYERCKQFGPNALTDAQLLAVLLRTGCQHLRATELAEQILATKEEKGLLGLYTITYEELLKIKGVGSVKAIQILCMQELTKRMNQATKAKGLSFTSPHSVASYYMQQMRHLSQEQVLLVLLNGKNKLLKEIILSTGSVNASIVSPRDVFIYALRYEAVYFILLHNHPSGDPTPSKEDIRVTKRIQQVGDFLGLQIMDHIIIGDNRYSSLKELDLL